MGGLRVDPALQEFATPSLDLDDPVVVRDARLALAALPPADVPGVGREEVADGPVRGRRYDAAGSPRGALLWFHGGAYVAGSPAMDDEFCAVAATGLGLLVLSVDYRLAPEHPFPAGLDDARAAWSWLRLEADRTGVPTDALVVGGQSAGGGLAAALVQRLVDEGEPVAAQWLWSPMLDDRTAADLARDAVGHPVFDNRANRQAWRHYLGVEPGTRPLPPYASPGRRERLDGHPPAWVFTSDVDLFLDEDVAYAHRLRASGVPVELEVARGAPHGFEAQGRRSAEASRALALGRAWLDSVLGSLSRP